MQNIGRGIELQAASEERACLLRYVVSRPAVLCFYYEDELPVIAAYTGRGLTGFFSITRAFGKFKKQLPDTVKFSEEAAPDHRKDEREQKKREKAEKKQARKRRPKRKRKAEGKLPTASRLKTKAEQRRNKP